MRFSVRVNNHRTIALLDNGSEGDLIDHSHVRRLNLPTFRLTQPLPLYLGNGKLYRELTEAAFLELDIGDHHEQLLRYRYASLSVGSRGYMAHVSMCSGGEGLCELSA